MFTVEQARPILTLIGYHESRNSYTTVYGGIPSERQPRNLTGMTIREVIEWQRNVVNSGAKSSAAGYYQIIRKTLESIYHPAGMTLDSLYDEAGQDRLGCYLLNGRGFQKYLTGSLGESDMMIGLAKEWASLPVPYAMQGASRWVEAGQSYYAGDGLNKAHARVDDVRSAIRQSKALFNATVPDVAALPDLAIGSRGDYVTLLQKTLTSLGYDTKGIDGIFGDDTQKALLAFQTANGLAGICDQTTWDKLLGV